MKSSATKENLFVKCQKLLLKYLDCQWFCKSFEYKKNVLKPIVALNVTIGSRL